MSQSPQVSDRGAAGLRRHTPAGGRRRALRGGWVASIELLFVLPILLFVALIIFQYLMIHAAYMRVQTAAIEGACLAAEGANTEQITDTVGVTLGFLAGASFEVSVDRLNTDMDDDDVTDIVVVGVRLPMVNVSTNYIGLLGGDVSELQIRSVVKKKALAVFTVDAPPGLP